MSTRNSPPDRHKPRLSPAASALERLLPHVVTRIRELWGHGDFEPYVNQLIIDSRDGRRRGLPFDAANELFFLMELSIAKRALEAEELTGAPFAEMFARLLASVVIAGQFGDGMADLTAFSQPDRADVTKAAPNPRNASTSREKPHLAPAASALEHLPHVITRVRKLWGKSEFEPYVNNLIMESREGGRQGLPWEAALELFFLIELRIAKRALLAETLTGVPFTEMFARFVASSIIAGQYGLGGADHWSDPSAHSDSGRVMRESRR